MAASMALPPGNVDTKAVKRLPLVLLVPLVLAAGIAAPPTGAQAQKRFDVKVGDTIEIVGTKVACFAVRADNGIGIACFKATAKGLLPGTYGAGLATDGRVAVHKVSAKGEPAKIWGRKLSSRGARYLKANYGDVFHLQESRVYCDVVKMLASETTQPGIKVGCYLAAPAPLVKSYGFAVSDRFVGIFRWKTPDAAADVLVKRQP